MRNPWKSLVGAASFAICAVPANAVPITFDLGGTIRTRTTTDLLTGQQTSDSSIVGQSFSARFVVETDAMRVAERIDDVDANYMTIRDAGATLGVQAFLTIGGVPIDVLPHAIDDTYAQFTDSNGSMPVCDDFGCYTALTPDSWMVGARSTPTRPLPIYATINFFYFVAQEPYDLGVAGSGTTWLDFSQQAGPDLMATLPTTGYVPFLNFSQYAETTHTGTRFNVTSFTRTVSSVPEPGSLGLIAMGLLGAFAARRKTKGDRSI